MKKLLAACILLVSVTACNENSTKETSNSNDDPGTNQASSREKEISDSTKILDKLLRDSNSTYSPDSLK